MEEAKTPITSPCSFAGIQPILMDLPYPPVMITEKNPAYANLLSMDYCGPVSEMSAITQYINNENRLSCELCPLAKTLLGLAMAEMMHLQKLGQLIVLLGGSIDSFDSGTREKNDLRRHRRRKISYQAVPHAYQNDWRSMRNRRTVSDYSG